MKRSKPDFRKNRVGLNSRGTHPKPASVRIPAEVRTNLRQYARDYQLTIRFRGMGDYDFQIRYHGGRR